MVIATIVSLRQEELAHTVAPCCEPGHEREPDLRFDIHWCELDDPSACACGGQAR